MTRKQPAKSEAQEQPSLRLEWRTPQELAENPRNWRTHPASQTKALQGVMQEVGWAGALLFNEASGRLIDGHARRKLALEQGSEKVPVLVGSWTEAQERLILATLDPIGALAEQDDAALQSLIDEVSSETPEMKALLDEILGDRTGQHDPRQEDGDVPEPPPVPFTKLGDLWVFGKHRLLCGDSTHENDVKRLMGGDRAGLMNTDPPYGISFDNAALGPTRKHHDKIQNDDLSDSALQTFLEAVFRLAKHTALKENAAWYMWHAHLTQGYFAAAAAAAAADVILHRQIIWVKPRLILGRGQYHWKHEPCFMGWVEGHQPPDYGEGGGERTQTTVWEVDGLAQSERDELLHASPKPVGLFDIPIIKHLKRDEIAYEPFAGSGPQFIAAEQSGRRCYGIEIDPGYCDVIVKRWEKFTGRKAQTEDGRMLPIESSAR